MLLCVLSDVCVCVSVWMLADVAPVFVEKSPAGQLIQLVCESRSVYNPALHFVQVDDAEAAVMAE